MVEQTQRFSIGAYASKNKTLPRKNLVIISALAVSLTACSGGTERTNSPTDSVISPPTPLASSSSPQTTNSLASVAIPGVKNVGEIKFKAASENSLNGVFDTINDSGASKIEVSKATPITAQGWAILAEEGRLPNRVIITYGKNNSLLAVTRVNLERQDVAKALKNPVYFNSGWNVTFNSSILPAGNVILKAWAYNSARKEATQLNSTREVVILD